MDDVALGKSNLWDRLFFVKIAAKLDYITLIKLRSLKVLHKVVMTRGGSRIPRRRGRQPMILPKFSKNRMKLRKFWAGGRRGYPLRFATDDKGDLGKNLHVLLELAIIY